jgi:hypothetical protein
MAKQTKASAKKSAKTSKAKKTGKEVNDKVLESVRGGIRKVGGDF